MILTEFDIQLFLANYWQKKPCLIKQFVADFVDPIDENDLAGLAQEDDVDSRIVSNVAGAWTVTQGPFDDFTEFCQGDWALLVQGVERYIEGVSELSQAISFLPNWRFDDVMVSFSTPNASVGAHIDEYDVFILQGKGSRRWQVGLPGNNKEMNPHKLLKQIEGFEPVIDHVLSPGDAIYIPPKHPHKGVSLLPCINYSMGFRAPTSIELLNGLLDEDSKLANFAMRYEDKNIAKLRTGSLSSAEVSQKELHAAKAMLIELINSENANEPILQYLSRQALPDFAPEENVNFTSVHSALENGLLIEKASGVRPIILDKQNQTCVFFIDGNIFETTLALHDTVKEIFSLQAFHGFPSALKSNESKKAFTRLVVQLINFGYWKFPSSPISQ